eukprot:SAG11_NODE_1116_length_5800_cov_21.451149_2_plen_675_part_00
MTLMKVVTVPLFALFCVGDASKSVDIVSPGLKQMWEHFDKKVSSLENELQKVSSLENEVQEEKQLRMSMQGQIDSLTSQVDSLTSQVDSLTSQVDSLTKEKEEQDNRIDNLTSLLHTSNSRRNLQSSVCGVEAVQSMLAVCCASDSPGNGHRLQEIEGCDTLPPTCSLECSSQFISIYENCQGEPLMEGLSTEDMSDWNEFYTDCSEVEAQSAAMMPNWMEVKMIRVSISSEGPAQPIIGPLPDLPPSPPPSPDSSSTDLEQYHAQCTTQNILTCVPSCNATTHGFELLATIDGTDTKFSCNLANMLFSWVGAAALGGFLGRNVQAFVSAVISGAAGTYVLTLTEDANVGTDLVVQPGQNVIISGDAGLAEAPSWGSGGFEVRGVLRISKLVVGGAVMVLLGGHAEFLTIEVGAAGLADGGTLKMAQVIVGGSLIAEYNALTDGTISTSLSVGYTGPAQCFAPYLTITDAWRSQRNPFDCNFGSPGSSNSCPTMVYSDTGGANTNDLGSSCGSTWRSGTMTIPLTATGIGDDQWYRIVGDAGNMLATSPPTASGACGVNTPAWLSDCPFRYSVDGYNFVPPAGPGTTLPSGFTWPEDRAADHIYPDSQTCDTSGTLPIVSDGTVTKAVCLGHGQPPQQTCAQSVAVGIVNCGGFFLWKLPSLPACDAAYCTVMQ